MIRIDDNFKKEVGERLEKLRECRKFSREALVEKLSNECFIDISTRTLSRYEKGENLISMDVLFCLVDIYGTTLDYVIYGKETSDDNSFDWYDNYKRLNRLICSTNAVCSKNKYGKMALYFMDEEMDFYWNRIDSYCEEKKINAKKGKGIREIKLGELDELFESFSKNKNS